MDAGSAMPVIRDILRKSEEYLSQQGLTEARVKAEMLLGYLLGQSRLDLYLNYNQPLTLAEIKQYKHYITRCLNGEPVQYIIGKAWFMGLEFKVSPQVLIPRFDTEVLVENLLTLLKECSSAPTIVDIGTGSGCIAISIKHFWPQAEVWATDICASALHIARVNAEHAQTAINFLQSDLLADWPESLTAKKGIWLVSNPPYITDHDFLALAPEVQNHEPQLALRGGQDGLDYYHRLLQQTTKLGEPNFALEVGQGQAAAVIDICAQNYPRHEIKVINDLSGVARVVMAYKV